MTDNEIKKALECCKGKGCKECPFNVNCATCISKLMENALDLINRLQAENERLKKVNDSFTDIGKMYSELKAEAIKDYKERLIFEIVNTPTTYQESGLLYLSGVANRQNEIIDIINGLDEKETVGEE